MKSPAMQNLSDVFGTSSPRTIGGMNAAPKAQVPVGSTNMNDRPLNIRPRLDARKSKASKKKRAKKLPAKPAGTGPWNRQQKDSDDNLRLSKKTKPQGKGIVKALGQKKTTGNFKKIEKANGKGAAIGALQNKLAKRRGQPIPFHAKKKGKKFAHKGHSHKSRKAMKSC